MKKNQSLFRSLLRSILASFCVCTTLAAGAQVPVAPSTATMSTNPQASCELADKGGERFLCKSKNVCVYNQSGAVMKVLITTMGRMVDGDWSATFPVEQSFCRRIYVLNQENKGIAVLRVNYCILDGFKINCDGSVPLEVDGRFTATADPYTYGSTNTHAGYGGAQVYSPGTWPNRGSRPDPLTTWHNDTWNLGVYGRVLPAQNFCGSNNATENSLTPVKACGWR